MKLPNIPLEKVAQITMGQSPPGSTYNETGQGLPFFQGKAEFGDKYPIVKKWCSAPTRLAYKNDILLSVRAPVGPSNLAPYECCIGRGLAAIRTSEKLLNQDYLWFFLKKFESRLSRQGQGAIFKAINKKEIYNLNIPLPPISEQRRIVEILDQADRLRRLRAEADKKAERILPSLFIKNFGDPSTNPMGWKTAPFGTLVEIGTQLVNPNRAQYKALPHIGGEHIQSITGKILPYETVENCKLRSSKFHFSSSHILFSKIRPYLNKVTLPRFDGLCSADIYPLLPKDDQITPWYLVSLLRSQAFLDYAKVHSDRLRIPKLNKKQLGAFETPIPDSDTIEKFEIQADKIMKLGKFWEIRRENIEKIFSTILYRAFTGDLTASWRQGHINELLQEMELQAKALAS